MKYNIAKICDRRQCSASDAVDWAVEQIQNNHWTVPHIGLAHGGGHLYFPSGTYLLDRQVEIPRHTIMHGDGDDSVLVWPGGQGVRFESFPGINYSNRAQLRHLTIVNDAPARGDAAGGLPDPLGPDRHVGVDVQAGAEQRVSHVWSIGWETHYRLSQAELFAIDSCTLGGRQIDGLTKTYGIHTCTLPGQVAGSTNINWFTRLSFNGPHHPVVVAGDVGNTFQNCHVNQSGPILFNGQLCTFEGFSFEGGPEDTCFRSVGEPGVIPYILATIRRCYVAADKHIFHQTGGSAYGLTMQECFSQAATKAMLKLEGMVSGPVVFTGNQMWGNGAALVEGDVYNFDSALYASSWYQSPNEWERRGVGVQTLHPTAALSVKG